MNNKQWVFRLVICFPRSLINKIKNFLLLLSNSLCKEAKVTWGYVIFYYWLDHINIVSIEATCMDTAQLYLEKICIACTFYIITISSSTGKEIILFITAIRYTQSITEKNNFTCSKEIQ